MADLELNQITKNFAGVVALNAADLHCERGEVHALLGENGAGKSTMVKILSGAVRADSGTITVFGRPLTLRNPRDAMRAGIGMVYQEFSLIPDLPVDANVFFGNEPLSRIGVVDHDALQKQTIALFDRLGIHRIDPATSVRDLPLAQRQLVEIAKALAQDPQVVIFDEATSALSREEVDWLLAQARQLASEGKIVLFISHRLSEVMHIADRITVFRGGQHVGTRAITEAKTDELVSLMLGRKIGGLFPPPRTFTGGDTVLETCRLRLGRRLAGVDLRLAQGEILGVGGLAGQGQAELFLSLFGIDHPEGEVRVQGRLVQIRNPQYALSGDVGLALVPEDRATQGLLLPQSLRDNITLTILPLLAKWGWIDRKRELARVQSVVEQLRIVARDFDQPVARMSGGNQQKVVLGKLLLAKPKILLLYDSTRGVDVGTKAEIFALLRELTERGASVLFYSTDLEELVHVCDRVLVMHDGKVAAELSGAMLTEVNIVRASMGETVGMTVAPSPTEQIETQEVKRERTERAAL